MRDTQYTRFASAGTAIPSVLRAETRWLTWTLSKNPAGKMTKLPDRSTRNAPGFISYEAAVKRVGWSQPHLRGVGFAFTGGVTVLVDPKRTMHRLIALDLDGCLDGDEVADWAREIVEHYECSYTEVSPSGHGLRVFLLVENLRENFTTKVSVYADSLGGKNPELQVFGLGSAQYVTVTGQRLLHTTDEPATVSDLSWLIERFGMKEKPLGNAGLPSAFADVPSDDDISRRVEQGENGQDLIDANWQKLGFESASEGFGQLVKRVLRACNGDGMATVDWILDHTAWGRGDVEESADPARYARRSWVEGDVARCAGKTDGAKNPASVFEVLGEQPPPPKPAGRIINTRDFLARKQVQRFLIDGLLPRTGLAQFFGDPGCGKTPFAMSLAIHVAHAGFDSWFGHDVDHHGSVLYMVGEDSNGLAYRCEAEMKALGLDTVDGLYWTTQPGQLCDAEDVARWRDEVYALGEFALIVVDTQSRNFGAGNENDTQDMTAFVNNLARLAEQLQLLVVLVHHTGHKNKDRSRGSSVMFGALDASYEVAREDIGVTARSTKAKNWAEPEPLQGTLVPVELGRDHKGRPITAITLKQEPYDPTTAFEVGNLRDALDPREIQVLDAIADGAASVRAVAEAVGVSKSTVDRVLKELRTPRGSDKVTFVDESTLLLTKAGLVAIQAAVPGVPQISTPCPTAEEPGTARDSDNFLDLI